jgi:hypothetical protein
MQEESRGYRMYLSQRPSLPGPVAEALFAASGSDWDVLRGLCHQTGLPAALVRSLWDIVNSSKWADGWHYDAQRMKAELLLHYRDLVGRAEGAVASGPQAVGMVTSLAARLVDCRWKVGGPDGRVLLAQPGSELEDSEPVIGMMGSAELAREVVAAHNLRLALS